MAPRTVRESEIEFSPIPGGPPVYTHFRFRPGTSLAAALAVGASAVVVVVFGPLTRKVHPPRGIDAPRSVSQRFISLEISPDPIVRDFGTANQRQQVSVAFSLANYTKRPITLLGARASCTCLMASDPPVVVQAGAKTTVHLAVRPKSRLGPYSEVVRVLNDSGRKGISLVVRGAFK
jgi:hypothetical protein